MLFFCAATLAFAVPLCAETPAGNLLKKPDDWFQSKDGLATLLNILAWQTKHGDWPKNTDTSGKPDFKADQKPVGTFDNSATTGELRVLARAFRVTSDDRYAKAFLAGFDHVLKAQYANGGWPQFYPLSKEYHRHITFNDGTMIRLMEFLRDTTSDEDFAVLDAHRREAAKAAVDRGIDCIVKCQVVVDGRRTVWCAQHDAESLVPVQARSYELPSLSGAESAGILRFLVTLDQPSDEVVRAVTDGARWFKATKIDGYRYRKNNVEPALVNDADAPPLWARFYEIESNRPIFSDRDGVVKYALEDIGSERRGGYTWYGNWGENVLKEYARWPHRQ
ncbi:MAG: pectate lyase [Planctomycetaceae bacterium]|nr:pectate lyase [Planctomycetaceae bacterium]MCB9926219.1 pectate lyase [Planctomycetaceae bacterium]